MDKVLDVISEFARDYHLVAWGLGGLALAFGISLFFQDVKCF